MPHLDLHGSRPGLLTSAEPMLIIQHAIVLKIKHPGFWRKAVHIAAQLSRRERQIVDVLFRLGEATVAEVMEEIPDPPSYSAVRATLRILEEKGHVTHTTDGPRYVYSPALPADSARKDALKHLVKTFFDGSPEQAAVALLGMSDVQMTEDDVEQLQERIRKAQDDGR